MQYLREHGGTDHNDMLIAQCARVIFVQRLFLFQLLFVRTIESKQYFIEHN